MTSTPAPHDAPRSIPFDDLDGYEKGLVARAFLDNLIKQGSLEAVPKGGKPGEIVFSVENWHLELLARFSDDISAVKTEEDILREKLRRIS